MIRLALASVAAVAIIPMQDILGLDGRARMNVPGRPTGNWAWRFQSSQLDPRTRARLSDLTAAYSRWNGEPPAQFRRPKKAVITEPFVGR